MIKIVLDTPKFSQGVEFKKSMSDRFIVVDVAIPSIKRVRGYRAAANLHHINFKA